MVDSSGLIRRKQRESFERFLLHPDERVRRYARETAEGDLEAREALQQER
jgi:hypothetical protein